MAENLMAFVMMMVSLGVLYFGAEFALNSAEVIGKRLGLSPLVTGMVLVGFGTSLPEFFVGHIAASQGRFPLALGSLLGSNLANLLLVLGLSGLIAKLRVDQKHVRDQLLIHLGLCGTLWWVLTRSGLNLFSALPLLAVIFIYLFKLYQLMKDDTQTEESCDEVLSDKKTSTVFIKLNLGFILLFVGGELLVKYSATLCLSLGLSEYIVSSIIVAFGTSFPELVTSIVSALKKLDTDMIVGNILGSNLFNCGFILGSLGVYEFSFEPVFNFELILLTAGAAYLLLLSFLKKLFGKASAFLFLGAYVFLVYLWIQGVKLYS